MYQFNQQGSQFQSNMQQPSYGGHYVQSHYQGQLSQPSFGQPGVIPSGYQASGQQSFAGRTMQSNYQNITPASPSLGPVISRLGWQAGPDLHQQAQGFAQPNIATMGTHYAASQAQGYSAGPVISHFGYQAGPESRGPVNQAFESAGQAQYQPQAQSFSHYAAGHAAQSQHPVYQATNAYQQAGPVISHYGGWESNQR